MNNDNYAPPQNATEVKNEAPNAWATVFAWLLILNGAIGLGFDVVLGSHFGFGAAARASILSIIGLISGLISLNGRPIGLLLGTLFYLCQAIRYYSPEFSFGLVSGLQAGFSFHPVDGETLVVNMGAIIGVIYGCLVLNQAWFKEEAKADQNAESASKIGEGPPRNVADRSSRS